MCACTHARTSRLRCRMCAHAHTNVCAVLCPCTCVRACVVSCTDASRVAPTCIKGLQHVDTSKGVTSSRQADVPLPRSLFDTPLDTCIAKTSLKIFRKHVPSHVGQANICQFHCPKVDFGCVHFTVERSHLILSHVSVGLDFGRLSSVVYLNELRPSRVLFTGTRPWRVQEGQGRREAAGSLQVCGVFLMQPTPCSRLQGFSHW